MDTFSVTVGQLVLSDPEEVFAQIDRTVVENPDTDLFVFPEFATRSNIDLATVPYLREKPQARETAEKWTGLVPDLSRIMALADRQEKAVLAGCIAQAEGQLFSRGYFYDPQERQLAFYDKSHVHWTEDWLRAGDALEPIDTRFGRIGILICYDMAFVEPTRVHGLKGAEILFALSAIPLHFHWKYPHRRMTGAAIFNQYYVVAANLGYTLRAPMGGYSGIYSPEGDLIDQISGTDFGYISATIDPSLVERWREQEMINPFRRPRLYESLSEPV